MMEPPKRLIFMKVGSHAGETFEQILERKAQELKCAGRIFWGYGGTACHPIQQVQPFAKMTIAEQGEICLLMECVDSRANPDIIPAAEFSRDGITWEPIPKGVNVLGSKYALILDEIVPAKIELTTDFYEVGIGPSRGKVASGYLQGRIDKACLTSSGASIAGEIVKPKPRQIAYQARMQDPFAVLLR